MNTSNAELV